MIRIVMTYILTRIRFIFYVQTIPRIIGIDRRLFVTQKHDVENNDNAFSVLFTEFGKREKENIKMNCKIGMAHMF